MNGKQKQMWMKQVVTKHGYLSVPFSLSCF